MAKYVQPNFDVYGLGRWFNQVQFDTSVYLKGATHISSPAASTDATPYTLLVESVGADVVIKQRQLGTMAWEQVTAWDASLGDLGTRIDNVESSVGALDTLTQIHDSSIGTLEDLLEAADGSITALENYDIIQDVSIDAVWNRWVESHRTGFLNQTETSFSFTPGTPTNSGTFTLSPTGTEWSYYYAGEKYTITGSKQVALNGASPAPRDRYFISIDSDDGTLISSTTPWTLSGQTVLVAYVEWDPSALPTYWIGEERHTMLIDRQMHKYLHQTRGTQFVSGGTLDGPDVGSGTFSETGVTDASNAVGISATEIADEDIFQTLAVLNRPLTPLAPGNTYVVWYRNGSGEFRWKYEDTPLPESGSYIEWCQDSSLITGQAGKYYNTYIVFTNLSGSAGSDKARFSIVPGHGEFDTLDDAIAENPGNLDWSDFPIEEYVLGWKLTWETSAGYTTKGKVALAKEPERIQVNATTASAVTTTDHNDLLGLQGGTASERYHLTLAQWNDYIGKTDVDASLADVWQKFGYVDSSIQGLDGRIATNESDITDIDSSIVTLNSAISTNASNISTNAGDITNIETSLGTLNNWNVDQDSSIVTLNSAISTNASNISTNATDISNLETSVGALDTLTQIHDSSIGFLWSYDQIQDASITAAGTAVQGWNGVERTDNSIGLGGALDKDTQIQTAGYQFGILGSMNITGDLTVDGSITYINTSELDVSDNIIYINTGLTGTPPVNMVSGMKVNRGDEDDYYFIFSELDDTFRIGVNASEGGLPGGTQAVATRQDAPTDTGLAIWADASNSFVTTSGLVYTAGSGLQVSNAISATGGASLSGLSGDTQTYALMTTAAGGGTVSTRQLGTMAFQTATDYVTVTAFNASTNVLVDEDTRLDGSVGALFQENDVQDLHLSALDGSVTVLRTEDIRQDGSITALFVENDVQDVWLGELDASIIRIDASLNDVIEATDLFYGKTYIDGSLAQRDTSITALNTWTAGKVDRSGDTMTGLLTFAASGFQLDSVTLDQVDVSGALTGLDTHIPTSGAVEQAINDAIVSGVTASNGVKEVGGDIQLGGPLTEDVSIALEGSELSIVGLQPGTTRLAVISDSGVLKTQQLGTMALETATDYALKSYVDGSLGTLDGSITALFGENDSQNLQISQLDGSIVRIDVELNQVDASIQRIDTSIGSLNTWIAAHELTINNNSALISNIETSIGTLNGLIITNTGNITTNATDISNLETSVGALDILTQRHEASIGALRAYDLIQDASIVAAGTAVNGWNGVTRTDNSIGLGGALDISTIITASATKTLTLAGLQTLQSDTGYVLVTEDAGQQIKTKELGTMAWETSTAYVGKTFFDSSVSEIYSAIDNVDTSLGLYVLKSGDEMTGGLVVGTVPAQRDVSIYGGLYVRNDVVVSGNLTVDGSVFITDVETIDVSAGFIHLNTGLTGTPPSSMQSGIEIGRGDLDPYVFIFDESDDTFRIGVAERLAGPAYNDASTQAVATREDTPESWGVGFWNSSLDRIDTSAGFTFTPATGLGLPIATDMPTEATALMWDGATVGSRELGSNAFSSTAYVSVAAFNASTNVLVDEDTRLDGSIGALFQENDVQDLHLSALDGSIGRIDTSVAMNVASINDLSTNKLDSVATAGGGSYQIYSTEADNVAYIKEILPGAGATITQDSSTITIGVTGAAGFVSKYVGTFNADGSTSFTVPDSSHGLGTGPFNVTVWEANEVVYPSITNSSGDVIVSWIPGSISGICDIIITG